MHTWSKIVQLSSNERLEFPFSKSSVFSLIVSYIVGYICRALIKSCRCLIYLGHSKKKCCVDSGVAPQVKLGSWKDSHYTDQGLIDFLRF